AAGGPRGGGTGRDGGRERRVAFLFPGRGAQHPGMARGIYQHEPVFRQEIDRCAELFLLLTGVDLRRFLHAANIAGPEEGDLLERTENAQPALFAVCYALARLWQSWGIAPKAMLGNSLG